MGKGRKDSAPGRGKNVDWPGVIHAREPSRGGGRARASFPDGFPRRPGGRKERLSRATWPGAEGCSAHGSWHPYHVGKGSASERKVFSSLRCAVCFYRRGKW